MANILHNLLICVFIGKRLNLLSIVHHIPHKAAPITLLALSPCDHTLYEDYFSRGVLGSHQKLGGRYRFSIYFLWTRTPAYLSPLSTFPIKSVYLLQFK